MTSGGGKITGQVTQASTQESIEGIEVCAESTGLNFYEECALTNGQGEYTISSLPTGEYTVAFFVPYGSGLNYVGQFYSDAPTYAEATIVSVNEPGTNSGIDAELQKGGHIHGEVTDSAKAPVEGMEVCASPTEEEFYPPCARTNANGEYTISAIGTGEYYVEFFAPYGSGLDYLPQYYNGKSARAEAEPVAVTAPSTTSPINATLQEGATIAGEVTNSASEPIQGIEICAESTGTFFEQCGYSKANGEYAVPGLPTGEYAVVFRAPFDSGLNYVTQFYNDKAQSFEAEPVSVKAPNTKSSVDATMQEGGWIEGQVTSAATKAPIEGILVCAESTEFGSGNCAITNSEGFYKVAGLVSGSYIVEFYPFIDTNYVLQYYNGKAEYSEANPVIVTEGEGTTGINATMHELGEKPPSGGGSSSGGSSSSSSSPPAPSPTIGVAASVAVKNPQVTVGAIKSKSGVVYASLHCGATSGDCPTATVELTVIEELHGGHVVGVLARTTKRVVVIGEVKVTLGAGQSETVRVSLNSTGKKLIAQHKKLEVQALVLGEGTALKVLKLQLSAPSKKKG